MAQTRNRIEPNPDIAFVYDVYGEDGERLDDIDAEKLIEDFFRDRARHAPMAERAELRVLSEGDSWTNLFWPFSGYPKTIVDVLDQSHDVLNLGFPGHTFDRIIQDKQYLWALDAGTIDCFFFSGGGNDLLGGGALKDVLRRRDTLGPDPAPADCLDMAELEPSLDKIERGYRTLAGETATHSPSTKLIVHGYDYAVPQTGGPWLHGPFSDRGYDPDGALARLIVRHLIDLFYERLARVAASNANTELAQLRSVTGSDWHDELHPNSGAAERLAAHVATLLPSPATS